LLSTRHLEDVEPAECNELRERVSRLFLRLIQQIHAGPARPWLDLHLTMPQLKMLFVVDWLGPISMGQLAGHLHISVSAATGLVDRLVEAALARREDDPRDRRVVRVSSTPAGKALIVKLRSASDERLGRVLDRLSQSDLELCLAAMESVTRAAEAELQSATIFPVTTNLATSAEAKG